MRIGGESAARRAALVMLVVASACAHETLPRPVVATPASTPLSMQDPAERRTVFAEAIALARAHRDDEARTRFAALLSSYPALEDYHLAWLAALAERGGRPQEAADLDDRLIANHPDSVWIARALARRAHVALVLGDPRASSFAAQALEVAGSDEESRGYALLVEGDVRAAESPAAAYTLYQRVRRLRGPAASVARQRAAALEESAPQLLDDPDALLAEGRVLMGEGRLDLAATRLAAAAASVEVGRRASALRALGRTEQLLGHVDEAIATYRDAARDEGTPGMAAFDLATILWNRDEDDEAAALFERLLRDAPAHPKRDAIRYALGRIAERRGDESAATTQYRRVVAAGGDDDLVRDARWRVAWMPYRSGRFLEAAEAFAALAGVSDLDRAAGLYWQARAEARAGNDEAAAADLRRVLAEAPESYYAELSEERSGESAELPASPAPLAGDPPPSIALRTYHWSRSEELRRAGLDRLAARELDAIARELAASGETEPYLLEAYRRVDATSRTLRLATRFERRAAIPPATLAPYLYPRAFWRLVSEHAAARRLDPYLVLALIRQESSFDPDAASPAAALGLMQLLVPTASRLAGAEIGRPALTDPATNVRLGTQYLRELLDRYDGNPCKALAAYNAGEDAVRKWEARAPDAEADEFVETISYRETRRYVKAVLGNYRRYRRLYGAPGEERALQFAGPPGAEASGRSEAFP